MPRPNKYDASMCRGFHHNHHPTIQPLVRTPDSVDTQAKFTKLLFYLLDARKQLPRLIDVRGMPKLLFNSLNTFKVTAPLFDKAHNLFQVFVAKHPTVPRSPPPVPPCGMCVKSCSRLTLGCVLQNSVFRLCDADLHRKDGLTVVEDADQDAVPGVEGRKLVFVRLPHGSRSRRPRKRLPRPANLQLALSLP